LPRFSENHSHLIPVEDYVRLERAVSEALRQTVGANDAQMLQQQLLSNYSPTFKMPRSQAMLLALREKLPDVANSVLSRSRKLYHGSKESA
jgi:hypothetical protein